MNQELVYTSVERGLKMGSRGYCTVASTPGMAENLAYQLESLSGYRHLHQPGTPEARLNPVNFSYVSVNIGGQTHRILSRVADAGLDYSNRSNTLAHHISLDANQLSSAGPAALAGQTGTFMTRWSGEPRKLDPRRFNTGDPVPGVCVAWKKVCGDAGWAGMLVQSLLEKKNAFVVFPSGTDCLALLREAHALLPSNQLWNATFSTYFTKLAPNIDCKWRFVLEGSDEANVARRSSNALCIHLNNPLGTPSGRFAEFARSGQLPAPSSDRSLKSLPRDSGMDIGEVVPEIAFPEQTLDPVPIGNSGLSVAQEESPYRSLRTPVNPNMAPPSLAGGTSLADSQRQKNVRLAIFIVSAVLLVGAGILAGLLLNPSEPLAQEDFDTNENSTAVPIENEKRKNEGPISGDPFKDIEHVPEMVEKDSTPTEKIKKTPSKPRKQDQPPQQPTKQQVKPKPRIYEIHSPNFHAFEAAEQQHGISLAGSSDEKSFIRLASIKLNTVEIGDVDFQLMNDDPNLHLNGDPFSGWEIVYQGNTVGGIEIISESSQPNHLQMRGFFEFHDPLVKIPLNTSLKNSIFAFSNQRQFGLRQIPTHWALNRRREYSIRNYAPYASYSFRFHPVTIRNFSNAGFRAAQQNSPDQNWITIFPAQLESKIDKSNIRLWSDLKKLNIGIESILPELHIGVQFTGDKFSIGTRAGSEKSKKRLQLVEERIKQKFPALQNLVNKTEGDEKKRLQDILKTFRSESFKQSVNRALGNFLNQQLENPLGGNLVLQVNDTSVPIERFQPKHKPKPKEQQKDQEKANNKQKNFGNKNQNGKGGGKANPGKENRGNGKAGKGKGKQGKR